MQYLTEVNAVAECYLVPSVQVCGFHTSKHSGFQSESGRWNGEKLTVRRVLHRTESKETKTLSLWIKL